MTATAARREPDAARPPGPPPTSDVPHAAGIIASSMTEPQRIAALYDVMGAKDASVKAFPEAIRKLTYKNHDRWVKPLYEKHWPAALEGRTLKKLRFLACNLYATAPYMVLFSSPEPPAVVSALRFIGGSLGFYPQTISSWSGALFGLLARSIDEDTHRRIAQIAAFIAAVDHVMDHCMGTLDGNERGKRMRGMLDGSWMPSENDADVHAGAFRFLRALFLEMSEGITGEDKVVYDQAVARLFEYVDAEVKAMTGVPDPTNCAWRMAGVLGTIDGLFFPVWRYSSEKAREWMYSVSLYIQIMDDWLDYEKDAADIRPTPILTGFWTLETVRDTWLKTCDGMLELAKSSGVVDEGYLGFVDKTYRYMMLEVADAMSGGGAG